MRNDEDTIRITSGGLQSEGLDGAPEPSAKLGLGDKKKVFILVALALAGAGIGAYQFLGGSGPAAGTPATAAAATTPAPGGAVLPATPASGAPTADGKAGTLSGPPIEDLSVARVEQLVKEFDGYVRAHQVALNRLHGNPFRSKLAPVKPKVVVDAAGTSSPAPATPKMRPAPKLTLGSILVAGGKSMAMINGKLCSVGSTIAGCRVVSIETDRVILARDGETYEVQIKPRVAPAEESSSDDN
jgi:hypothetical protein